MFRQPDELVGFTHAIIVAALVRSSELLSATVMRSSTPSNCIAFPKRPPVTRVGPLTALKVPLFPLPLLSTPVVPRASSSPTGAPGANGFTVTFAEHDVVWLAASVTFSVTDVVPGAYGP